MNLCCCRAEPSLGSAVWNWEEPNFTGFRKNTVRRTLRGLGVPPLPLRCEVDEGHFLSVRVVGEQ